MFIKWKYKYKSELHLSLEYLQNNWQRKGLGKTFLSANFQDGDCYFGKKRMIKQIRAIFLIWKNLPLNRLRHILINKYQARCRLAFWSELITSLFPVQHLTAMEWVYAQSSLLRTRMLRLRSRVVCLRVGWGVTWRARTQGVGSPTSRHILSPDDPVLRHKSNQEKKNTHTRSKSHKCLNLYTNIFFHHRSVQSWFFMTMQPCAPCPDSCLSPLSVDQFTH